MKEALNLVTLLSIIMNVDKQEMHLAIRQLCSNAYHVYNFQMSDTAIF